MNRIKKLILLMYALFVLSEAHAQLTVTGGGPVSANALVSNLVGQGITFSNANYTGQGIAVGYFNGVNSNIGLNSGVILTSGSINVAPGPNNNAGAGFSNNGPSIPALNAIANSPTRDGAILEFDFIPQSDYISFRYVFASEEYNEYVCSEFNDAFAFFISGPGIVGAENLAVVPSTNIPVTINTINNGTVGALGFPTNDPCILGNAAFYVNNTLNSVQYDGFTTVLTAYRQVIPCQTYHIRLMIADGFDDIFDSAVFLEENSFSSTTFTVTSDTYDNSGILYEGCTNAVLTISRPDAEPDPLTINYTIGGTATNGIDYTALSGTVVIPANQSSTTLTVEAFQDGIPEGAESLLLTFLAGCTVIEINLSIQDRPPVQVVAPDVSICEGNGPVTLTATASEGVQPYSYLWNTGATSASISVNPGAPTPYTVTVTDFCGTQSTANPMVNIEMVPTASLNAPPFVCSGIPVTVNYTGTAPPSATYIWNFDGAANVNSSSQQGPYTVSWDTPGIKTITVQVVMNGCSSIVASTQVNVNPTPTAEFEVDPVVCAGQIAVVTYTGTGTDGGAYGWSFPGGVIVTGGRRGPFEIRWDSVGVYGVTLTVTENGCTSPPNEVFVTVQPTPTGDFTATSPVCVGENSEIVYQGNASPTATYNWNFGGGNVVSGSGPSPYLVNWNTQGNKTIFLTVTENGCTGETVSRVVNVRGIPQNNFSVSTPVCQGTPAMVTYTGNSPANSQYTWDFGGGQIVNGSGQGPYEILFDNTGSYQISLTVSRNGCTSTDNVQPVQVLPRPVINFDYQSPVCVGEAATINYSGPNNPGMTFNWNFSGGIPISGAGGGPYSVYWETPGNKVITLIGNSAAGCPSEPVMHTVIVNPTPSSTLTAQTPICLNETSIVTFTGNADPNAVFSWNFNNGTIISGEGAGPYEIQWNTPGVKNISLSVSQFGCVSPVSTQQVNVRPIPSGSFTAFSPVCAFAPSTISYSGNAGPGSTYIWDFDNGTIASGSGPGPLQVYWETPGIKTVQLVVQENGCSSVQEITNVQVNPIPSTNFSATSPLCIGENGVVTYLGDGLPNASYTWNFDGAQILTGAGQGPFQLTWNTPGIKNITLQITQAGCTTPVETVPVTVFPIPTSNFLLNSTVCAGQPATIQYTGTGSATANYSWNFNGGVIQSGSGMGPYEVVWNTPGVRTVTLSLQENGCISSPTQFQVTVMPIPTSDFNVAPIACEGYGTTITFAGNAQNGAIFNWNFGGGSVVSGTGAGPYNIEWNNPGPKTISLTVTQQGCPSIESSAIVTILPTPESYAGPDFLICSGDTVQIGSEGLPGHVYQWLNFTGVSNSQSPNPLLTLNNLGNETQYFNYVLSTSLAGCAAYDTMTIGVLPLPQANIQVPEGQCLQGNSFDFTANGNFSSGAHFEWNFGNQSSLPMSNLQNPSNVSFNSVGTHIITFQVYDNGCYGPLYQDSIRIFPMPVANFDALHREGCPPLNVSFQNQSSDMPNMTYSWNFGNGGNSSTMNPQFIYNQSGNFSVTLTVTTAEGCSASFTRHNTVYVYPAPIAGFSIDPDRVTTVQPLVNVFDESIGATSWHYSMGDGTSKTVRNPSHLYPNEGEYLIIQTVTNEFGCTDTAQLRLKSDPEISFYVPNAFTPNGDGYNDIFRAFGINIQQFRMEIYNRWGELVFESNDIEYGWNGRLFNNPNLNISQMDVYAWVIYVKDQFNLPPRRIDGRVTLVR
ncbi:MAG: choice-of-anchor L domain-containing protein [Flavobacteriales bacterium]